MPAGIAISIYLVMPFVRALLAKIWALPQLIVWPRLVVAMPVELAPAMVGTESAGAVSEGWAGSTTSCKISAKPDLPGVIQKTSFKR